MPEEINRVVTDVLSYLLFTTSPEAETNLAREGIDLGRVHFVGNPMIDTLLANLDRFDVAAARARLELVGPYGVATLHRPANVDDPATAARIVAAIRGVAELVPLVIPLHPRGRATLEAAGLADDPRVIVIDPLGYVDFLSLVRGAAIVVTDSGGIQENDDPRRPVPHRPAEHRAPDHDQPRHEPARGADEVVTAARAALDGSSGPPPTRPALGRGGRRPDRRDRGTLAGPGGESADLGRRRDRRDRVSSRGALRPACLVRGAGCATPASPVTGLEDP
jgi:UDP-N-acetylglucosamine 2-epimerase (non-hydrolysing)